ncbi:MAG TPA: hypothetical protein VNL14_21785 [Candidatus Acidoferrales bacterium]|nr:hypothetical protein [Candidatus Acidoferrales bacterium]
MRRFIRGTLIVAIVAGVAFALLRSFAPPPKPEILFARYGESYREKPDFALVERQFPLTPKELKSLRPENLKAFNQEQLDQLYARLTAGPLPDGPFGGEVLRPDGAPVDRAVETAGSPKGLALKLPRAKLEMIVHALWRGKVFYRAERIARTAIEDLEPLRPFLEGEVPKAKVKGKDAWLLFPAKVYCGQSLLDGRRESIVIDYAFADEIAGYREMPDSLAGRNGFGVRDEIRMVRPGLYLGRAYVERFFALNFFLHSDEVAARELASFARGKLKQDCWPGTQVARLN